MSMKRPTASNSQSSQQNMSMKRPTASSTLDDVITSSHLCASSNASSQLTADCWRHSIPAPNSTCVCFTIKTHFNTFTPRLYARTQKYSSI